MLYVAFAAAAAGFGAGFALGRTTSSPKDKAASDKPQKKSFPSLPRISKLRKK